MIIRKFPLVLSALLVVPLFPASCFRSAATCEIGVSKAEDRADAPLSSTLHEGASARYGSLADRRIPGDVKGLEIPSYAADEDIYVYSGYASSYSHTTLCPNWVAYRMTSGDVAGQFRKNYPFSRDPRVKGRQASREDYSHSGYDKGHMAPRADMKWSKQAYYETFFFTNVCPQAHKMNSGCWRQLEQMCRRVAKHYGTLYVVTGPIFDSLHPKTIGRAKVHVPDRFFKALLAPDGDGYHAIAFVMENTEATQAVRASAIPVDSLEQMLRRDLFPALEEKWQRKAEACYDWDDWRQ